MKKKLFYVLTAFALLAALIPAGEARAASLHVGTGQTYTKIQDAIDDAIDGDTVIVHDGTYNEQLFIDKRITLISENGSDATVIDSLGATALYWVFDWGGSYTCTIYPTVWIDASGVVLGDADQGFRIEGADQIVWHADPGNEAPEEMGAGILNRGAGCTIEGNVVADNSAGLWSMGYGPSNEMITNNIFVGNGAGIQLCGHGDTVDDNAFIGNWCAIVLEGGGESPTSAQITDNELIANGQGIELHGSFGNTISANTITDTHAMSWGAATSSGIAVDLQYYSGDNTISNNTISKGPETFSAYIGIRLSQSGENDILSNEIADCEQSGVQIENFSNGNLIRGNTVNDIENENHYGIGIIGSGGNSVVGNTVHDCWRGVSVMSSLPNAIGGLTTGDGNTVYSCENIGIILDNSHNQEVLGNTVYDCFAGIHLLYANHNTVKENITWHGASGEETGDQCGICLRGSSYNVVRDNDASYNSEMGIKIVAGSYGNQIAGNTVHYNADGIQIIEGSNNNDVCGNDIRNNTGAPCSGVHVDDGSYGNTIRCNNIVGNLDFGAYKVGGEQLNALNNWWGSADGPGGAGPGSGDAVNPQVDFYPWATVEFPFPDITGPTIYEAVAVTDTVSLFDTNHLRWVMGDAPYSLGPSYTQLIVDTGCEPCNACDVVVDLSVLVLGLLPGDIGDVVAQWEEDESWKYDEWQSWMNQLENTHMNYTECWSGEQQQCYWYYDVYLDNIVSQMGYYFGSEELNRMIFEEFRLGEFAIPVTAFDCGGSETHDVITLAVVDFQLPLEQGWNLRSVPISTTSTWGAVKTTGKDMGEDTVVLAWDANAGRWIVPGDGEKVLPLQAYYVYTGERDQVGFIIERDMTAPPARQLYAGWNLVGLAPYVRSFSGMPIEQALSTVYEVQGGLRGWSTIMSLPQGLEYYEEFHYLDCGWLGYSKSFRQDGWVGVPDEGGQWMTPGGGYWVFMTNPGVLGGFSYTPIPEDDQAPCLAGFNFDPSAVDTTSAPTPTPTATPSGTPVPTPTSTPPPQSWCVDFNLHITDDGTGFSGGWVDVRSPSSIQYRGKNFSGSNRVSGNDKDGVYECSIAFPQYGEPGTWHVCQVNLWDNAGNWVYYSETDLRNMGFDTEIEVTCIEDITAPVLEDFSFAPTSIDTTAGVASVVFTLNLSDAVSGINSAFFNLHSPSCSQYLYGAVSEPDDRTSGDANAGGYECTIVFPQGCEGGTWTVSSILVSDAAGNSQYYYSDDLDTMGLPYELEVTGGPPGPLPSPTPTAIPTSHSNTVTASRK